MASFDLPSGNNNNEFGRDTGRSGGDYDNNSGSTGFGNTQSDRVESSNTSGGYGQDHSENARSNMDGTNDSAFTSERTMDSIPSEGRNSDTNELGSTGRSEFDSSNRNEFDSSNRNESDSSNRNEFGSSNRNEFDGERTGKVSMGDKLKGGAEKLAGKMTGNAGLQERGQERKMGEYEQNNF
ncbi:hypothetical protein DFH09DRAFT_1178332 [Mycena vulgaris]|nr:hypothetical protein DFH09DRAFT_1178332 [Mycena vulgaris]